MLSVPEIAGLSDETAKLAHEAAAIIETYRAHWPLSVRQVLWRLHAEYRRPVDTAAYETLTQTLVEATRARVIDLGAVVDEMAVHRVLGPDTMPFTVSGGMAPPTPRWDRQAGQDNIVLVLTPHSALGQQLRRAVEITGAMVIETGPLAGLRSPLRQFLEAEALIWEARGRKVIIVLVDDLCLDAEGGPFMHAGIHDFLTAIADHLMAQDVGILVEPLGPDLFADYGTPTCDRPAGAALAVEIAAIPPDRLGRAVRATVESHLDMAKVAAIGRAEEGCTPGTTTTPPTMLAVDLGVRPAPSRH